MPNMKGRSVVIFGSGGRIGNAAARILRETSCQIAPVSWFNKNTGAARASHDILAELATIKGGVDIVFASGLTDPAASAADLLLANVERPLGLLKSTIDQSQFRYLTIGSALETFPNLAMTNRYLASKAALWARIAQLAVDPRLDGRIAHLRIHTAYGGAPTPHSFLGQMHESLRARRPFRMSEGRQLREYVHVDDLAQSIAALLGRHWNSPAAIDLSAGEPVSLAEVARAVFQAFDCEELLQLGALPTPVGENTSGKFVRSPAWLLGRPRPAIEGIVQWLSDLIAH
jgi:nucleoside-diphosphate-sugar epimerase